MATKQAVQVLIRTRPTDQFASNNLKVNCDTGDLDVHIEKPDMGAINNQLDNWQFKFNKILHNATQDDVYDLSAANIVSSVVSGYNGTVMCYGQTGAGKTFSMLGLSNVYKQRGIIPRAIQQVYHDISSKFDQAITIKVSYVEIYNERMVDLLAPPENIGVQAKQLSIMEDARGGVAVKNLSLHICENEEEALNQLFEGETNRNYAAHELNSHSSRSHCIYTIYIESRSRVESTEKMTYSKLQLVDLAGSERTKKTNTSGSQLVEARHINKSLSYLEQVVLALSDKKRDHVPYRQTMLTNYLRDSIGGNCKTVMVANVQCVKSHIEETISTLKFATRMMKVKNSAVVNSIVDPHLRIKRLEKEIRDLKQELAMHDTLANRGRINYDQYSNEQLHNIQTLTDQFLDGEIDDIEQIDSLRMIREIFNTIKNKYKSKSQHIESIKRQIEENPEKFKQMLADQAKEDGGEEAKEEAKAEPAAAEEAEGEDGEPKSRASARSKASEKKKRPPTDKQTAYLEFKENAGRNIEESILMNRNDIKKKRVETKNITQKINFAKQEIDKLKNKLEKKEEERKLQNRGKPADLDAYADEDDIPQEDIIDEEELVFLKDLKDMKRDYRDNYSLLKANKQELINMQSQIDASKEQLIYQFENWYAQEFEAGALNDPLSQLNLEQLDDSRAEATKSRDSGSQKQDFQKSEFQLEDEDAAVYRRAKQSVDELHRARKFEKSIKL